jgi:hypothetical protein
LIRCVEVQFIPRSIEANVAVVSLGLFSGLSVFRGTFTQAGTCTRDVGTAFIATSTLTPDFRCWFTQDDQDDQDDQDLPLGTRTQVM